MQNPLLADVDCRNEQVVTRKEAVVKGDADHNNKNSCINDSNCYQDVVAVGTIHLYGVVPLKPQNYAKFKLFTRIGSVISLCLSIYFSGGNQTGILEVYLWYFVVVCWILVPLWQNYSVVRVRSQSTAAGTKSEVQCQQSHSSPAPSSLSQRSDCKIGTSHDYDEEAAGAVIDAEQPAERRSSMSLQQQHQQQHHQHQHQHHQHQQQQQGQGREKAVGVKKEAAGAGEGASQTPVASAVPVAGMGRGMEHEPVMCDQGYVCCRACGVCCSLLCCGGRACGDEGRYHIVARVDHEHRIQNQQQCHSVAAVAVPARAQSGNGVDSDSRPGPTTATHRDDADRDNAADGENGSAPTTRFLPFSIYNLVFMVMHPGKQLNPSLPPNMRRFGFSRAFLMIMSTGALSNLNMYIFTRAATELLANLHHTNGATNQVELTFSVVSALLALFSLRVSVAGFFFGILLLPLIPAMYSVLLCYDVCNVGNPPRGSVLYRVYVWYWNTIAPWT